MIHVEAMTDSTHERSLGPLACPSCQGPLASDGDGATCRVCRHAYEFENGVWRLLRPEREGYFARWIEEYDCIRSREARDFRHDPAQYKNLPERLPGSPHAAEWAIRRATYRLFMKRVIGAPGQCVLDLGAGNGWLSYRLARAGHQPWAIDLRLGDADGLGAAQHYESALETLFPRCQAEFVALPFVDGWFDVAVFNASFHYATDYEASLTEVLRVLRPGGRVAILDTPVYHDASSGRRMMLETHEHFERSYGFRSDSVPVRGYITYDGMNEFGRRLGLRWRHLVPWYGWRWAARPWTARLLGRREPAQFGIWIGTRS
ncbi:MAG: methyltransferase domain-containing protein [Gemmatimonadales bacterium]